MLTSEVLRKAKALIDSPEKWCKVNFNKGDAMCSLGAIMAVTRVGDEGSPYWNARCALGEAANTVSFMSWQDFPETTHADVMHAFARAIEYAEAREQAEALPPALPAPRAGVEAGTP